MPRAKASHILVNTEEECLQLKTDIQGGLDFSEAAKSNSLCPSGKEGGDLGEFFKGQMVPEFDAVVFSEEIGKVHGPIKTQFGYHLIQIEDRQED